MSNNLLTPDIRFGTSFLDVSKSKLAVRGEVMMDKVTGEIFIKRVLDGKVISFSQQDTSMQDGISKLNVLLQNTPLFRIPILNTGLFVDASFNINGIMDETTNILLEDIDLPLAISKDRNIILDIDKDTNGFFFEALTRENDRNIVSYLNLQYNLREGSNGFIKPEEYKNVDNWENGNVLVSYEVTTEGRDESGAFVNPITATDTISVRLNDYSAVIFPDNYKNGIAVVTKITVRIKSFRFPKLQDSFTYFMRDPEQEPFSKIIEPDYLATIKSFHVMYFLEDENNVPSGNNVYINQMIDLRFLEDFLSKVQKASTSSGVILSTERPSDSKWTVNNAWAESTREVGGAMMSNPLDSPTNFYELEKYLYTLVPFITKFTYDRNDLNGIYVKILEEI